MKRILLEISAGLAVLVLLASLHHQIARLEVRNNEVEELRELVSQTAETASSREELAKIRSEIITQLQSKIDGLERKVAQAAFSTREGHELRSQLDTTRREAEQIKAQLKRDISRTQETLDAYHRELRSYRSADAEEIRDTRRELRKLSVALRKDNSVLSRDLLSPVVQLNGDDTVGSGTLIYSGKNPKNGKVESFVVTSYHVIRNILADTPRARSTGIDITIYQGPTRKVVKGDMIAHDQRIDAALVRLRGNDRFENLALVANAQRTGEVRVWDDIYAVGCPLGNDPIPTQGEISSLRNELNGANYWMINAPTYFGNSGGGIFLANSRELIGVFSKIYTHGRGTPVVIPHMGLFTPMPLIRSWLKRERLDFVLNNSTHPRRDRVQKTPELIAAPAPR